MAYGHCSLQCSIAARQISLLLATIAWSARSDASQVALPNDKSLRDLVDAAIAFENFPDRLMGPQTVETNR